MTTSNHHPDTPDDHAAPTPPSDAPEAGDRADDPAGQPNPAGPVNSTARRRRRRAWWYGGAAALACLIGAGVYTYERLQPAHHLLKSQVVV